MEIYAGSFLRWLMTIANKVKIRYPLKKTTYTVIYIYLTSLQQITVAST